MHINGPSFHAIFNSIWDRVGLNADIHYDYYHDAHVLRIKNIDTTPEKIGEIIKVFLLSKKIKQEENKQSSTIIEKEECKILEQRSKVFRNRFEIIKRKMRFVPNFNGYQNGTWIKDGLS